MMEIDIRRLASLEEYMAAEELQLICWQTAPRDAVPAHLLLTIQSEAGVVLGAFTPDQRMIGFVFGFLSREGETLKLSSHMAAVHPDFRDHNLGYRLKLAQREFILEQNLTLCTWTYDPLEARNAVLNIAKLGATVSTYKRNIYGRLLGGLNSVLPTDRFYVRWNVTSLRATQCAVTGKRVVAPVATGQAQFATRAVLSNGVPIFVAADVLPKTQVLGVHIPSNFQQLKLEHADVARAWRFGTRDIFEEAFRSGFVVVNANRDAEQPDAFLFYTLQKI